MATVVDPEQLDTRDRYPRTYALRVEAVDPVYGDAVATFYKFGMSGMSIAARFRREPADIRITILKLWRHETTDDAKKHEAGLFKRYRPTCLFEGFPPCPPGNGPLSSAKGNTELFLANRLHGEKDIKLAVATFWEDYTFNGHFRFTRAYLPPELTIYKGRGSPGWLDWLREVPDEYMFLPDESRIRNKLIFVRENYLFDFQDFAAGNRKREEFQEQALRVHYFDQAENMAGIWRS